MPAHLLFPGKLRPHRPPLPLDGGASPSAPHSLAAARTSFRNSPPAAARPRFSATATAPSLARLLAANPHLHADAVGIQPRHAPSPYPPGPPRTPHRLDPHPYPRKPARSPSPPPAPYELINLSPAAPSDCLTPPELNQLVTRLTPHLAPNSIWFRVTRLPHPRRSHAVSPRAPSSACSISRSGFSLPSASPNYPITPPSSPRRKLHACRCFTSHSADSSPPRSGSALPSMHLPPQRPKARPIPPTRFPSPGSHPAPRLPSHDPGVFHHDVEKPKPACQPTSDE